MTERAEPERVRALRHVVYYYCRFKDHWVDEFDAVRYEAGGKLYCPDHLKPLAKKTQLIGTRPRSIFPTVWRTVQANAAGLTTIWTPGAGLRFRLMGGMITVPGRCTLAAAGIEVLTLYDGAETTQIAFDFALPAAVAAIPLNFYLPLDLLPDGYISRAPGSLLRVNLGTALSAGNIRICVWGSEE